MDAVQHLLSFVTNENGTMVSIHADFQTYQDQEVDLADACLMHLGNREKIRRIFTLDRRHFGVYRMADGRLFQLLPD